MLEDEPETYTSCPLDEAAEDNIKIDCMHNIDTRLQRIRKDNTEPDTLGIPEIRLEPQLQDAPSEPSGSGAPLAEEVHTTTLVSAKPFNSPPAHRKHLTALLRLLYIHSCLNPASQAPHIPALLVPLYLALTREIEPTDAAHAEADTFWLFEALVGEFAELEDEEGGKVWMQRFSERLSAADGELAENLVRSSFCLLAWFAALIMFSRWSFSTPRALIPLYRIIRSTCWLFPVRICLMGNTVVG